MMLLMRECRRLTARAYRTNALYASGDLRFHEVF
jgi:hypothetical protein